jgi:hypothetical protein
VTGKPTSYIWRNALPPPDLAGIGASDKLPKLDWLVSLRRVRPLTSTPWNGASLSMWVTPNGILRLMTVANS